MAARRRRRAEKPYVGRDAFKILHGSTELAVKGHPMQALVAAQGRALNWEGDEPVELTVERQSLFGPATTLYRLVRDECGVVLTYTLSQED